MKNVKVPLFGNPGKSATIDAEATNGATVGKNLFNADGSLVTTAQLSGGASTTSSGSDLGTSDDLDEGSYNLYFTARRAQDAVGSILVDSVDVDFSYDPGVSISAALTSTGVDSGTYGDATHTVTVTVDGKGRITSIVEHPIDPPIPQIFNRIDASGDIRVDADGNLRVTH
ncbi:hypothetical protein [Luteibacter sp. SG786]|uniref:hypothetical protein n=1 Tax=Luteibacter sp. SG786 TaxID=2587130 RepID=UPI00141E7A39|nr:hypothetical protein [Luteibacter sp. SG786]NII54413.1 hypothetical protein [Luteibacter sp. SG786]